MIGKYFLNSPPDLTEATPLIKIHKIYYYIQSLPFQRKANLVFSAIIRRYCCNRNTHRSTFKIPQIIRGIILGIRRGKKENTKSKGDFLWNLQLDFSLWRLDYRGNICWVKFIYWPRWSIGLRVPLQNLSILNTLLEQNEWHISLHYPTEILDNKL